MGGSRPVARPHLFTVEVQDSQDGIPIQEEVKQQMDDNEVPMEGNSHEENEGDENPIEDNEDKEGVLYFEDECKSTMTTKGAMRKDEGSSEDKHVVCCAMMHEEFDRQNWRSWKLHIPFKENGTGHASMVRCIRDTMKNAISECST